MIMMVPGVIFDIYSWQNSVTFKQNIPNLEARGQNQGGLRDDGQSSLCLAQKLCWSSPKRIIQHIKI